MTDALETDIADVTEIVEEAKSGFSLIDRIKNRDMRTAKLDLGYDEVNSERLAVAEQALARLRNAIESAKLNAAGIDELTKLRAKLKRDLKKAEGDDAAALEVDIAEVEEQISQRKELLEFIKPQEAKLAELDAAAAAIRDEVRSNSLSIELRALPFAIARGASRRARKALGITEKGIPADQEEAFQERNLLELAYDQVVRYRDNSTGEEGVKLSVEELEALRDFLPISQMSKLFTTVNDLQFRNAVSESAIAQADF
ncbi:hypothetical protein [Leifsonia aquatica]|uniref:hypothetical protein n=1 Tax=Leifsonia aquatica TaxID=144185 RepID=UPI000468A8FD|nr:hypothetical protein [Leifsonia aquatica]